MPYPSKMELSRKTIFSFDFPWSFFHGHISKICNKCYDINTYCKIWSELQWSQWCDVKNTILELLHHFHSFSHDERLNVRHFFKTFTHFMSRIFSRHLHRYAYTYTKLMESRKYMSEIYLYVYVSMNKKIYEVFYNNMYISHILSDSRRSVNLER